MRFALVALFAACSYSPPLGGDDASVFDAPPPDVIAICPEVTRGCTGNTLVDCQTVGAAPVTTDCGWGCSETGSAHCLAISPNGGSVTTPDMDPSTFTSLGELTLNNVVFNTNTGTITGNPQGVTVDIRSSPNVTVFKFKSLTLTGSIKLVGDQAIAIVADGAITISGIVNAQGCEAGVQGVRTAGPGGFDGGDIDTDALGSGGGKTPAMNTEGAGGGGHAAVGGKGGSPGGATGGAGGLSFGTATINVLVGGGGGGGGPGGNGGTGGGGGGALQLVSNTSITIDATGGINAGGCGGGLGAGGGSDGGGGGGAGGALLFEAPTITLAGSLAVNGGGGGGSGGAPGSNGTDGRLDRMQAAGGAAGTGGGGGAIGGLGGAGDIYTGGNGNDAARKSGGGGAVGWMRFHTRSGTVGSVDNAKLSPSLDDAASTCTQGPATLVDP